MTTRFLEPKICDIPFQSPILTCNFLSSFLLINSFPKMRTNEKGYLLDGIEDSSILSSIYDVMWCSPFYYTVSMYVKFYSMYTYVLMHKTPWFINLLNERQLTLISCSLFACYVEYIWLDRQFWIQLLSLLHSISTSPSSFLCCKMRKVLLIVSTYICVQVSYVLVVFHLQIEFYHSLLLRKFSPLVLVRF